MRLRLWSYPVSVLLYKLIARNAEVVPSLPQNQKRGHLHLICVLCLICLLYWRTGGIPIREDAALMLTALPIYCVRSALLFYSAVAHTDFVSRWLTMPSGYHNHSKRRKRGTAVTVVPYVSQY